MEKTVCVKDWENVDEMFLILISIINTDGNKNQHKNLVDESNIDGFLRS